MTDHPFVNDAGSPFVNDATDALARALDIEPYELRQELAALGYEIVSTEWLYPDGKPIHQAAEAADREAAGRIEHGHDQPALDAASLSSAAADPLDVEALIESWRTTYDTGIHKGKMAYAVEAAWDASVLPVGDPEDGIEMHDLGKLSDGIIDALLAAYAAARRGTK